MDSSSQSIARLASSSKPTRNLSRFRSPRPRPSRPSPRRLLLGEGGEELSHRRWHLPDAGPAGCEAKDFALAELAALARLRGRDARAFDDVDHFALAIECARKPTGVDFPKPAGDAAVCF